MKLITPPKLIPPFHSTAASGTFPMEHTNDAIETRGPTTGPQSAATRGSPLRKNARQNSTGTHAPRAPAMRRPPAMSFQIAAQSITK